MELKMKINKSVLLLFGILLSGSNVLADVVVVGSPVSTVMTGGVNGGTNAIDITYTPDAVGNVLVVGTYLDGNFTRVDQVTFGGSNADEYINASGDSRSSLCYFEVTSAAEMTISTSTKATSGAMWVYELSGVDLSQGVVTTAAGGSLTTTADNTFVVGLGAKNSGTGSITTTSLLTQTVDLGWGEGAGGRLAAGVGTAATAGANDVSWSFSGGTNQAQIAIGVIPEPATLGLVGAFGGSILFLRRRMMM